LENPDLGGILVVKQTTRIESLVGGYVVYTIRCYGPKNFGCKRKRGKAVRGDHVAIPYRALFLVKLLASVFGYMSRDKAIAIARMTMVIEKPRMCQGERRHRLRPLVCPHL